MAADEPPPEAETPTVRAQQAFDHAVATERAAIAAHEDAARRHEEIAGRHERAAEEADGPTGRHLRDLAQTERDRAARARARAVQVRNRLRADGVDPDA